MNQFEETVDTQLDIHFTDYMWPSPSGDVSAFELFKDEVVAAHNVEVVRVLEGLNELFADNPHKGYGTVIDMQIEAIKKHGGSNG